MKVGVIKNKKNLFFLSVVFLFSIDTDADKNLAQTKDAADNTGNLVTADAAEVSAANIKARDAQYLAVVNDKCEPASLFETIPNYSELDGKTSTFASAANIKTLAASDLAVTDTIKLGVELTDPWDNRHKYVGFGLGD